MLIGIVACGGQSKRMGMDKSLLQYHGVSQRKYLFKLLNEFCDKVLLSFNPNQDESELIEHVTYDSEKYKDRGPVSGLLSVMEKYVDHDCLLIGCDYPNINSSHIETLLSKYKSGYNAIAFAEAKQAEPLLALYTREAIDLIRENFLKQEFSLNATLKKLNTLLIEKDLQLFSVDTPEQLAKLTNEE